MIDFGVLGFGFILGTLIMRGIQRNFTDHGEELDQAYWEGYNKGYSEGKTRGFREGQGRRHYASN